MAGPSIKVSFLSDFSRLKAGIADVGTAAKTGGSTLKDAFSPALAVLNRSGVLGPFKDALDGVGEAISQVKEHITDLPLAIGAAGAGIAGIGVALSAMGSKDQAAHQQLQAAVEATGKSYDDYGGQVDEAIKKQEHFGNTAATTQDALRILTQATNDPAKALQLLGTASDLAAAKHESLDAAAGQLGKTYNGATRLLKEFGVTAAPKAAQATKGLESATKGAESADKALMTAKQHLADIEAIDAGKKKLTTAEAIRLRDAQQKVKDATANAVDAHKKLATAQDTAKAAAKGQDDTMTALSKKLSGQASAAADTFGGKLKELKAKAEDSIATFGQRYGGALQAAGAGMAGLGAAMKVGQGAMEAAKAAALGTRIELGLLSAAQKVSAAAQWLLNAAMDANPIVLIVIAVAALVAILIVVLVKTGLLTDAWNAIKKVAGDVWHFILAAIKAVWDWIQANWPLLVGILLGPIGIAAALIWKYWDQILKGIQGVWNWIRSAWGAVIGFLTQPIAAAIGWIQNAWGGVIGAISGVVNWIRGVWGGLYGTLTGVFSSAINWITGAWNGVVNFFAGLPGRIAGAIAGVYNTIIGPFRDAWNWVQSNVLGPLKGGWNAIANTINGFAIHVTLPEVDTHIPGIGKIGGQHFDWAPPRVPTLAAGGLLTSDGLIYAHAGEVVAPIEKVMRTGPVVAIQNATFSTEMDVESFMRQTAWLVRTQGV